MSIATPAPPTVTPRRPSPDEVGAIAGRVRQWADATVNVQSAGVFTHAERPTVRVAVVSRTREYDRALDEAVTQFDLSLAQDSDLAGIDVELKLFFAASADQVAGWARGWGPWTDA
jgi:hypothetical protein